MSPRSLALAWALAAAGPAVAEESGFDRYRVLAERSMFSRERHAGAPADRGPRPGAAAEAAPPADPDSFLVLVGVIVAGETGRAVVEDVLTGRVLRVEPGTPLGRGRVLAVRLGALDYEVDGGTREVPVGETLALGGRPAANPWPARRAGPATAEAAPAAPGTAAPPPPGEGSVLERMRQRRQRETGR